MSDNRSSMKIWMMAAAAIVVVGGGLIVLIWFIMSGRTSSNGIVVPQLTVEKIPSLIEDIKSQNGESLAGLSTIISLFDSNKKIEGKGTPEKNAQEFFTKYPEIAFKIRQVLDFKRIPEDTIFEKYFDLDKIDEGNLTANYTKLKGQLVDDVNIVFLRDLFSEYSTFLDQGPSKSTYYVHLPSGELSETVKIFTDVRLFRKAIILNNGWRKDFVRFFNQHLDKEHRLDIEKYCPWLTSERKFCDNLNSFMDLIALKKLWVQTKYKNISFKAFALESKMTVDNNKPDGITNTEVEKYLNNLASKHSKLIDLNNKYRILNEKETKLNHECFNLKSQKEEFEKKKQEMTEVLQEMKILKYLMIQNKIQYFLDMEKFAWWSFISSKVMTAAPRASVSVLQNVLPEIKKLDGPFAPGSDLTEKICAKLIVDNFGDLDKTLMSEEIEANEKSAEKKDKDSAEKEKNNQLSTKQKSE